VLPGHGGLFDRLDSLLLPIPFLIWYVFTYLPHTLRHDGNLVHSAVDIFLWGSVHPGDAPKI
jgi:hypothetical protein